MHMRQWAIYFLTKALRPGNQKYLVFKSFLCAVAMLVMKYSEEAQTMTLWYKTKQSGLLSYTGISPIQNVITFHSIYPCSNDCIDV